MGRESAEIICIIDRSGSMQSIRSDAIGCFNAFLDQQKKEPGSARLTLVMFNSVYDVVLKRVPLEEVLDLTEETYVPMGTTALLDAMGKTIDSVATRLMETPEDKRPERVIFAILTDGQENASTSYTRSQVFEKISRHREANGWEFTFLAANQDAIVVGRSLGIPAADSHSFGATPDGIKAAYQTLSSEVSRKRRMPQK